MTVQHDVDTAYAAVPLSWLGPIRISGDTVTGEEVEVPLATFETPLWPSVGRGARISMLTERGIVATLLDDRMTRSVLFEADDAATALAAVRRIRDRFDEVRGVAGAHSRHCELIDLHHQIAANLLFLRFEFTTGDAAGHNMATQAADQLMAWILANQPGLRYGSVSGNFCTDKKPSAVNGILGRGKSVVTEITVPQQLVEQRLHTTAAEVTQLNTRKNLLGTVLAGGIRSANAHYANMLLGFYLATGQDAANIVEGSQGITYAEDRGGDLYFSCTLPNLIVGSVGNGKHYPFVENALQRLGCREPRPSGTNARRLAVIAAATVLCGELSLLAAQTNPGELMRAHTRLERSSH
ncbi:hydroxymethylglutaryl-CoA reductase [Nocardia goodfellowii]|uniref:Hydroxymethylglutaryl-CoA reductase (NADPH) n=1 Tax=Nocardia goodfellowii TaxID=882446 RepID=A0ABS4QKI9_9NOCA|nr:hydroxymethylglutaryl-CoA reductase [Nocardia goodfellowii]MBP2191559.1 hydroxymethylglutaryl-CoA reductase (NADPH) [Nocardia goodfellowii]